MNSEDAIKAVSAIRTRWPYQPMSEREEHSWCRALTDTLVHATAEEFRDTLARFVAQGGSKMANQEGRRPGIAEFMGSLTGERSRKRPAVPHTRTPEPWPEFDEEGARRVSERVAAIKRACGLDRKERTNA